MPSHFCGHGQAWTKHAVCVFIVCLATGTVVLALMLCCVVRFKSRLGATLLVAIFRRQESTRSQHERPDANGGEAESRSDPGGQNRESCFRDRTKNAVFERGARFTVQQQHKNAGTLIRPGRETNAPRILRPRAALSAVVALPHHHLTDPRGFGIHGEAMEGRDTRMDGADCRPSDPDQLSHGGEFGSASQHASQNNT